MRKINRFSFLTIALFLYYLIQYVCLSFNIVFFDNIDTLNLVVIFVGYFWYMLNYRRDNILCFELIFIPLFAICLFFQQFILETATVSISGAFRNSVNNDMIVLKSKVINMIGLMCFFLGLIYANNKNYCTQSDRSINILFNNRKINGSALLSHLFSMFILFLFVYLVFSGALNSWFQYGTDKYVNNANQSVGTLTRFLLMNTIGEFYRMSQIGVDNVISFIKKANKIYLFNIVVVSSLLIVSGNRGESMQIFFPVLVCYTIFINKIPTLYILLGVFLGASIMIISGWSRGGDGIELGRDTNIYEFTKDFGFVNINSEYLIYYTDKNGPSWFMDTFIYLISGIPLIGPIIITLLDLHLSGSGGIATDGMQVTGVDSGLGTSIIGDLYYTASLPYVIIMMWLFGYFLAYTYNCSYKRKSISIWQIVAYCVFMSNCVYFIRDSWYRYLEIIIYDLIVFSIMISFLSITRKKNEL